MDNTISRPAEWSFINFGVTATSVAANSQNNKFYNCTFANGYSLFASRSQSTGTVMSNCNIFNVQLFDRTPSDGANSFGVPLTGSNNNIYSSSFSLPNTVTNTSTHNPLFINTGIESERFKIPSASLLKDAGIAISGVTTDFQNKNYLNQSPIGAFDFGGVTPSEELKSKIRYYSQLIFNN